MKLTNKTAGFGIMAVGVLMLCTAAIADNMGDRGPMGMMGPMPTFEAMDANKDGKVSKDEVTTWRATQTASVDADGDGKLSVDELAAMHLKEMTEAAKAMAQKMVDRMDTDGDGLLSAAELVARPMPAGLFDRIDTNRDGFVDQAELAAAKQAMMQHGPDGGRHGRHRDQPMPGNAGDMDMDGMSPDVPTGN